MNIAEQWFTTIDHDGALEVFRNPTRAELLKLLADSPHDSLRAWVTQTDLYCFAAHRAIHNDVADDLPVDYDHDARVFIDRDGAYYPRNTTRGEILAMDEDGRAALPAWSRVDVMTVERDIELCRNNPALRRLFGSTSLESRRTDD